MEELENILSEFINKYKESSIEEGKTASKNLINSLNYDISVNNGIYRITINADDYFKYAEEGRSPGKFPPIDKIREWIRVKPVLPRTINGKLPTENQLSYLISRKIALKGTEGSHLFKRTEDEFQLVGKLYNKIVDIVLKSLEYV